MGLALRMALKIYSSVSRRLKLKVRKFWEANSWDCWSSRGKLVGWVGKFLPHPLIPNRVNILYFWLLNLNIFSWLNFVFTVNFMNEIASENCNCWKIIVLGLVCTIFLVVFWQTLVPNKQKDIKTNLFLYFDRNNIDLKWKILVFQ